jgi:hypothetical protein
VSDDGLEGLAGLTALTALTSLDLEGNVFITQVGLKGWGQQGGFALERGLGFRVACRKFNLDLYFNRLVSTAVLRPLTQRPRVAVPGGVLAHPILAVACC